MNISMRIEAFVALGKRVSDFLKIAHEDSIEGYDGAFSDSFRLLNTLINRSFHLNGWFTRESVLASLGTLPELLSLSSLSEWLSNYPALSSEKMKKVGVVMAGNIPLVGFHDFLTILISGNSIACKLSSQDKLLLPELSTWLEEIEPQFKGRILFTEAPFKEIDAVIATGSDNSSRYFDYYFSKYPHIIRKNRNSIAVLSGNESTETIEELGKDIFNYYGLGCRSISKLMLPKSFEFDKFFNGIYAFKDVVHNNKYGNNYDYHKTVFLLNNEKLLDNGFLILKEDASLHSPQACLYYEYYEDFSDLTNKLLPKREKIQCVVSELDTPLDLINNGLSFIPPGCAQQPKLNEYADGIDTLKFLMELN